MLLLDDEDELPRVPGEAEQALAKAIGPEGLGQIDHAIISHARSNWSKVARVIVTAMETGGFPITEAAVNLHARRVMALANSGVLESQGGLKRPRCSEVRMPGQPTAITPQESP